MSVIPGLPSLQTSRLLLRPYTAADVDALYRLWTDAAVRKYLWDDEVISRERAAATVAASVADAASRGFGQWGVCWPATGEVIGFCGFRPSAEDGVPELLYGLVPSFWGKGLATEAARAVLEFGFDVLDLARVIATTEAPNAASWHVLERLGMRLVRRDLVNGRDTLFFAITKDEWRSRSRAAP